MKTYVYTDNSQTEKPVVFICEAGDILEADKLYKETIGLDPVKQSHIGCEPQQNTRMARSLK